MSNDKKPFVAEFSGEAVSIGACIYESIGWLKRLPEPQKWAAAVPITRYYTDADVDVVIKVSIVPKKSQKQIGLEMFHGPKTTEGEYK